MKKKITISGMHCASCASNIERSLKKLGNVKNVSVSLLMKKGFVESEEGKEILDEDIRKAVSRTGYKVENIEEE